SGGGTGLGLAALLVDAFRWSTVDLPEPGTAERMGTELFQSWVLPFEVLSVLLLSALVGAIAISVRIPGRRQ
ncbi:NADH-quinone oxidoreductase subunit J, partial [Plantactinospora sp. S1510]